MAKRRFLEKQPLTEAEGLTALIMMGGGAHPGWHQRDDLDGAECLSRRVLAGTLALRPP